MHDHAPAPMLVKVADGTLPIALSPKAAAESSSLSLRTIMQAVASGALRSSKKGRRRIILVRDLALYLRDDDD